MKQKIEIPPELNCSAADYTGKHILVRDTFADPCLVFLCSGGFGCNPELSGRAVMGVWLSDGTSDRIDRHDAVRFASAEEIAAAKAYASKPASERMLNQLVTHNKQVEAKLEAVGKKKPTRDELVDALACVSREYGRLWHILNFPDSGKFGEDLKPIGPTPLTQYTEKHGANWDAGNRSRQ